MSACLSSLCTQLSTTCTMTPMCPDARIASNPGASSSYTFRNWARNRQRFRKHWRALKETWYCKDNVVLTCWCALWKKSEITHHFVIDRGCDQGLDGVVCKRMKRQRHELVLQVVLVSVSKQSIMGELKHCLDEPTACLILQKHQKGAGEGDREKERQDGAKILYLTSIYLFICRIHMSIHPSSHLST